MTILRKPLIALAALLVISTVPVACVNNAQTKKDSPPVNAALEARALGRWDELINKNFDLAYLYFSPAYRKLFPLEHYLSKTGSSVDWKSTKIKNINFDGKRAEVKLTLDYRLDLPMGAGEGFGQISKDMDEVWLWVDDEWWYVITDEGNLF